MHNTGIVDLVFLIVNLFTHPIPPDRWCSGNVDELRWLQRMALMRANFDSRVKFGRTSYAVLDIPSTTVEPLTSPLPTIFGYDNVVIPKSEEALDVSAEEIETVEQTETTVTTKFLSPTPSSVLPTNSTTNETEPAVTTEIVPTVEILGVSAENVDDFNDVEQKSKISPNNLTPTSDPNTNSAPRPSTSVAPTEPMTTTTANQLTSTNQPLKEPNTEKESEIVETRIDGSMAEEGRTLIELPANLDVNSIIDASASTTIQPTEAVVQELSLLEQFVHGTLCAYRDCTKVLVPTAEPKRRLILPPTITRRARREVFAIADTPTTPSTVWSCRCKSN
ncbi:hypothetical protein M3Y94_00922400 [Aphelenchoides besseyi]|nr:hypothetical protein M3Y94_00922400 [Aphelenchoides besseyi]KAI6223173.1 hypothetical protein M3Y95_00861500 [Aphelenchoides besseyi]